MDGLGGGGGEPRVGRGRRGPDGALPLPASRRGCGDGGGEPPAAADAHGAVSPSMEPVSSDQSASHRSAGGGRDRPALRGGGTGDAARRACDRDRGIDRFDDGGGGDGGRGGGGGGGGGVASSAAWGAGAAAPRETTRHSAWVLWMASARLCEALIRSEPRSVRTMVGAGDGERGEGRDGGGGRRGRRRARRPCRRTQRPKQSSPTVLDVSRWGRHWPTPLALRRWD